MAERGTPVVLALLQEPDAEFITSTLTAIELRSAIGRLASTRQISPTAASDATQLIDAELTSFTLIDISPEVLAIAKRMVDNNRLRTLDALQCATAILVQQVTAADVEITFVAADRNLLFAAQANGLTILNPEDADTP